MALDHHGTAVAEEIATGTATAGYVPVSAGVGVAPAWTAASGLSGITEFITGDSSNFGSTIGSWAATGGTLTRDVTAAYQYNGTASLKWATTTSTDHIDLPISGTFKAGVLYQILLAVAIEEVMAPENLPLTFGLIGTDSVAWTVAAYRTQQQSDNGYAPFMGVIGTWTPSSDRTGVSVRLGRTTSTSKNVHIGSALCRNVLSTDDPGMGLNVLPVPTGNGTGVQTIALGIWSTSQAVGIEAVHAPGEAQGAGIGFQANGGVQIMEPTGNGYVGVGGDGTAYMHGGLATPASLSDNGINIEVGPDYVGIEVSEKDASTVQVYSDAGAGYDVELVDRGTHHFKHVAADGGAAVPSLGMLPQYAAAPASPVEGQSYYNLTDHHSYTWDGSAWKAWW